MSGSLADTGTEIHTTAIDAALSEQYVQRIIAEMKRLNCRTLIVGECGCDARTFLVDKANQFRRAGLSVAYLDDVLVDALERGKLVARHRLPVTATLHDPCWLVRKGGYRWSSRRILERCVASDRFVELTPNLEHNLCCRGGAGMLRAYPTTDAGSNRRREQSLPKAAQLRHSGAQVVVSPCTTCVLSLGDIVRYHGVKSSGGKPMEVRLLIEMLHAAVTGRVEAEA